jgi:hypothetical protein
MLTDLLTSTNESRDHPLLWFPCLIASGLPLLALKLDLHPCPETTPSLSDNDLGTQTDNTRHNTR